MLTEEERRIVAESRGKDPARLALTLKASQEVRPSVIAQQVDAYNRLRAKVPTWAQHEGLEFPFPVAIQQCSSEPLARFRSSLTYGDSLIDLTGGLGVDCFFMGYGKSDVTYVDANEDAVSAAEHNYKILRVRNTRFENCKAEDYVAKLLSEGVMTDTMFIDPSRRNATGDRVYRLSDCSPDVTKLAPEMLKVSKVAIVKLSPLLDISLTIKSLSNVTDVYAVGHGTECKDVMVRLSDKDADKDVTIHAVTLDDNGEPMHHISFTQTEERSAKGLTSADLPKDGDYIFIPSPAVMKAAPFALLTIRYAVKMLAPGTHVYTKETDVANFPGRKFIIKRTFDLTKKSIGELRKETSAASIAVRNFHMTAEELRKRLKLGESSQDFIFGVTASDGKPHLLLCAKAT